MKTQTISAEEIWWCALNNNTTPDKLVDFTNCLPDEVMLEKYAEICKNIRTLWNDADRYLRMPDMTGSSREEIALRLKRMAGTFRREYYCG